MSPDRSTVLPPGADVSRPAADLRAGSPAEAAFEELVFPTTVGQKRFWSLDALQPGNTALNMPLAFRLAGRLDRRAVQLALDEILRRHEVLRCRFEMEGDELVQVVQAPGPVAMRWIDCVETVEAERVARVEEVKIEEGSRPFNLAKGPLLRGAVATFSDSEHVLMISMHHIVSDGWSNGVVLHEFAENYTRVVQGRNPPFEDLPLQYADFSVWQQEWLKGPAGAAQRQYWNDYLGSEVPALNLPTDRPRGRAPTHNGAINSRLLPLDLSERFRQTCQRENATPFMGYLAAYVLLLHRYSGRYEFVIGSPAACRNQTELEGMIGLFANPVLFRPRVTRGMTFRQLLHHIRDATLANFSRQEYPFELLAENLRTEESRRGVPWLQAYFIFQKAFLQPQSMPDLELTPLRSISPGAMFEWMLGLVERAEGVRLQLEFNTDLFDGASIDLALIHLERIVSSAARSLDFSVDALTLDDGPVVMGPSPDLSSAVVTPLELLAAGFGGNSDACLLECAGRKLELDGLRRRLRESPDQFSVLREEVGGCLGARVGACPAETVSSALVLARVLPMTASDVVVSTGSLESCAGWEELLTAWSRGARVVRSSALRPAELLKVLLGARVVFSNAALVTECLRQNPGALSSSRLLVLNQEPVHSPALQYLGSCLLVHRISHPATGLTVALFQTHPAPPSFLPPVPEWKTFILPGWKLELIDQNGNVAPVGVPGRLRLSCANHSESATSDDWMRLRSDERLEWIGNDRDVNQPSGLLKEVHEISRVATGHPAVWWAAACVVTGDRPVVALHMVLRSGAILGENDIRNYLEGRLPSYLVPTAVAVHSHLPLAQDGRVDGDIVRDVHRLTSLKKTVEVNGQGRGSEQDFRNGVEVRLGKIFSELLRLPDVDPQRSFFELGGHSLLGVRLFARIEQEFQQRLPLAMLLACSSVRALAERIQSPASNDSKWPCLVPIQTDGAGPRFFCVHGAGGNVLLYRDLARHMAPKVRFYGLQAAGLDGGGSCLTSVGEMAELYLQEILKEQPQGPYHVGGYCMGGNIAYEIAQLLIRKGEKVGLVALLDTYNLRKSAYDGSVPARARIWVQKIGFHLDTLVHLDGRGRRVYLAEKYRMAREYLQGICRAGRLDNHSSHGDTRGEGQAVSTVQAANHKALRDHDPQPFPGNLVVFKPRKNYYTFQDPRLGWGNLVKGKMETIVVTTNPHTMLVDPFVEALACHLTERIAGQETTRGIHIKESPKSPA